MEQPKELLGALNRDFWAYATLALDPASRRALEEECRRAGGEAPGRLTPAARPASGAFVADLESARRMHGKAFVHHAGYYCGANAGRRFEANVLHPNEGARRLAEAVAATCTQFQVEAHQRSLLQFEVALLSVKPLPSALMDFASGFVKGAAIRLNEGAVPAILEKPREGGKVWAATIDWAEKAGGAIATATGGRKTPRK